MNAIRVYVPSSLRSLQQISAAKELGTAPSIAHAVTEAVRDAYADGGEEEWEYAAASAAGLASVGLLTGDEPARRVVLAVDVPRVSQVDSEDPTAVRIDEAVPFRRIAAVLADAVDAETDVARAREAVASGASDADVLLERCLAHELGWWATQEIDVLLEEAGSARPTG
ncbi:MAG: DUF6912 family protein [Nocardioidaceae bacterium]